MQKMNLKELVKKTKSSDKFDTKADKDDEQHGNRHEENHPERNRPCLCNSREAAVLSLFFSVSGRLTHGSASRWIGTDFAASQYRYSSSPSLRSGSASKREYFTSRPSGRSRLVLTTVPI